MGLTELLRRALPQGEWPNHPREPDELLVDRGARLLEARGARAVPPEDPHYPRGLRDLEKLVGLGKTSDPRIRRPKGKPLPIVFLEGPWDSERTVAVVGSRRATIDGVRVARELGAYLAGHGVAVVSGLAQGIDAAAHEGAIDAGGRSGAVLGTPLDDVFPAAHARLQERLAASLGLMTQVFPGSPPHRGTFSVRNHLLAAVADVTVIVQGRERSGALITAGAARAMGRPVGAIPWDIYEEEGAACLGLVRAGHATLLRSPGDALALIDGEPSQHKSPRARRPDAPLGEREARALASIGRVPRSFDDVAAASGLSTAELMAALLKLELLGLARREAGGRVRRAPRV